jgi:hypothetical protein
VQVGQNLGAESGYELLETQVLLGCMLVSAALPEYDSVEKMALGRLGVSDEPKNVGNFAISGLAVVVFTMSCLICYCGSGFQIPQMDDQVVCNIGFTQACERVRCFHREYEWGYKK